MLHVSGPRLLGAREFFFCARARVLAARTYSFCETRCLIRRDVALSALSSGWDSSGRGETRQDQTRQQRVQMVPRWVRFRLRFCVALDKTSTAHVHVSAKSA